MTAATPPLPGDTPQGHVVGLLDPLFGSVRMREVLSDRSRVQAMLDVEAALARANARAGAIPASAAAIIERRCDASLYDLVALGVAAAMAGNPAIPLVKWLTEAVAQEDAEAARFVHWGGTSQDIIDTGFVLQMRAGLDLLAVDLARLAHAVAGLASSHALTPVAGRTLMQQALPTTFGLQAAGWLSALTRDRVRLRELQPRVLAIQFGGAAGTLASLGELGLEVAAALARDLELVLPDIPWHTQRDRMAETATTLGLIGGTLGKIARDLLLLMQTEIGEVSEPHAPGRGGSSSLPHKRNPVGATVTAAAALRIPGLVSTMLSAMVQEHGRAAGGWHAEWETLPEIFLLVHGGVVHLTHVIAGLEVDTGRMRENLELTRGLILAEAVTVALAPALGRMAAHQLVERACAQAIAERRHLRQVLSEFLEVRTVLSDDTLARLFDPRHYVGLADVLVSRALATAEHLGDRPREAGRA
jgi:3-carboxy-cis,cis-muconate cycloisomerase